MVMNVDQFWRLEHPTEPPDEDQPIKCPIPPGTSPSKDNAAKTQESSCENFRRKAKLLEVIDRTEMVVMGRERPRRAVRRRYPRENTPPAGNPLQQANHCRGTQLFQNLDHSI
ncbi:OLC1v1033138C1 [Oldenlandia corymbosa var. corymbosa]|uniref:OLC1v1033138C1 n=1 Tax=Oldenlandia corymbosa var. corymbosa TaxID=529605 RepID=A0AAV1CN92_OLDCO|nr:OLC1v1033138C1 [Oldenlandia corymbosa var. corymbosa]